MMAVATMQTNTVCARMIPVVYSILYLETDGMHIVIVRYTEKEHFTADRLGMLAGICNFSKIISLQILFSPDRLCYSLQQHLRESLNELPTVDSPLFPPLSCTLVSSSACAPAESIGESC